MTGHVLIQCPQRGEWMTTGWYRLTVRWPWSVHRRVYLVCYWAVTVNLAACTRCDEGRRRPHLGYASWPAGAGWAPAGPLRPAPPRRRPPGAAAAGCRCWPGWSCCCPRSPSSAASSGAASAWPGCVSCHLVVDPSKNKQVLKIRTVRQVKQSERNQSIMQRCVSTHRNIKAFLKLFNIASKSTGYHPLM